MSYARAVSERRQLTVLFCDLVGSTALASRLDPEDLRDVVRAYQEMATTAIARHDGHIAQYLGDGLLVYFGFPKAHEDDAARAVRAGLEIASEIGALVHPSVSLPAPLRVRVGIHTGLVVVGDVGGGDRHEALALGETPNVAARLQALAEPNDVVISDVTQRLVDGLFDVEALGDQPLKGLERPVRIHRVRRARGIGTRFAVSLQRGLTPLVGRRAELDTLLDRRRDGHGVRVVNVVGEAGLGKSRLLHEFASRVPTDEATFLRGHCTGEGRTTPFLPFVEVLRTSFRIAEGEDGAEVKLARALDVLGVTEREVLPYLLHLLGRAPAAVRALDPELLGARVRHALECVLEARSRLSPTALIVEDLHWIDAASEEFLDWAGARAAVAHEHAGARHVTPRSRRAGAGAPDPRSRQGGRQSAVRRGPRDVPERDRRHGPHRGQHRLARLAGEPAHGADRSPRRRSAPCP